MPYLCTVAATPTAPACCRFTSTRSGPRGCRRKRGAGRSHPRSRRAPNPAASRSGSDRPRGAGRGGVVTPLRPWLQKPFGMVVVCEGVPDVFAAVQVQCDETLPARLVDVHHDERGARPSRPPAELTWSVRALTVWCVLYPPITHHGGHHDGQNVADGGVRRFVEVPMLDVSCQLGCVVDALGGFQSSTEVSAADLVAHPVQYSRLHVSEHHALFRSNAPVPRTVRTWWNTISFRSDARRECRFPIEKTDVPCVCCCVPSNCG